MACRSCGVKFKKTDWKKNCYLCDKSFHVACTEYGQKMEKMNEAAKNKLWNEVINQDFLKWCCTKCKEENVIEDVRIVMRLINLEKKVESIYAKFAEEMSEIRSMIKSSENVSEKIDVIIENEKFSEVVKKKMKKKKMSAPSMTIKPIDPKKSMTDTKKKINEKLDENQFGVINSQVANKNGLKIVVDKKENLTKLVTEAKQQLGDEYEIVQTKQRMHRIKIVNAMLDKNEFSTEDENKMKLDLPAIETFLKQKNATLMNDEKAKVIFAYDKPKKSDAGEICTDIIMQVSSPTHKKYMEGNYVSIGWTFCKVFDGIFIKKCMNCLGFGHAKDMCKKELACSKCGGKHVEKECSEIEEKCINCMRINKTARKNICDVYHNAKSKDCPALLKLIEKISSMTSDE